MAENPRPRGPWSHRFWLWLFTIALGVLLYWLLGFVLDDIGSWPGPDYHEFEAQRLDRKVVQEEEALAGQLRAIQRRIEDKSEEQRSLRDSTDNSQRTMNQLLEFQRLNLQRDVKPSAEEQQALAESEQLFLANQKHYQILNEELVKLNAESRGLEAKREANEQRLSELREPIRRAYEQLMRRHALLLGGFKLAFLLPILVIAAVLFVRGRQGRFAPLVYALGAAALVRLMLVMHEYFPARYFKYVLILSAIAAVVWVLVYLVRMLAHPKRDWLLRQYREAYEAFLCPICTYPIRRGPLKYLTWTRRSIKNLVPAATSAANDEPYVCPACSTRLYEKCQQCGAVRPSLLPSCQQCGHVLPAQVTTI